MYDSTRAQELEDKIQSFTCEAELRIERVKITSEKDPQ